MEGVNGKERRTEKNKMMQKEKRCFEEEKERKRKRKDLRKEKEVIGKERKGRQLVERKRKED